MQGSIPIGGTCLNDFSDPIDQDMENSGIRVAVGDCSVTECHIKSAKLYVHTQTHYKHDEDGQLRQVCADMVPYC